MHLGYEASIALAVALRKDVSRARLDRSLELAVCPSATALAAVGRELARTNIRLGAQDVFWADKGAYTGSVAVSQLSELGCTLVIVGHSERRRYLRETDDDVNRKVRAVLLAHLIPIICVGETLEPRRQQTADLTVMTQVIAALHGIPLEQKQRVIIAYEPVWVIGTGHGIVPREADHMSQVVRQALIDLYPLEVVERQFRIIYGGSVDHTNIRDFLTLPLLSGALVGGASVQLPKILPLLEQVASYEHGLD